MFQVLKATVVVYMQRGVFANMHHINATTTFHLGVLEKIFYFSICFGNNLCERTL